jgi:hypothetical protein
MLVLIRQRFEAKAREFQRLSGALSHGEARPRSNPDADATAPQLVSPAPRS